MRNPARSMCGCTTPSPARLPIDRDPPMGCATVEPLAVPPAQDRPFVALSHGEIDGAGCARHERDHRGLVALSDDREGPVSTLDGEVLDVRTARFGHPQAVEAEQHSQCGVHRVVPLSGEQEGAELGAVHPVALGLGDLGAANVLGGVGGMRPSMCANR